MRLLSFIRPRFTTLLAASALLLTACSDGSGGGSSSAVGPAPETTLAQGSLNPSVIVMPSGASGAAAAVQSLSDTQAGLSFNRQAARAELANAQLGSVVVLPPDAAAGLPQGFAGVVTALDNSRVSLQPAALEDVFDKLSFKFDSTAAGTRVAATYLPRGAQLSLQGAAGTPHQVGLDTTNTLGTSADGKINGTLTVAQEFVVDGKKLTLQAVVNLKDFALAGELDFDKEKFLKQAIAGDPWFRTKLGISGTYDSKVSIKTGSGQSVTMNIADIFRQQSVWDDLKFNHKYFTLEGLSGSAKKGRWAIGGIALTPVGVVKMTQNNIAIKANSGLSIVLWMYIDSSGTVTFDGEFGVKSLPASLDIGAEFSATGATYDASRWNRSKINDFEAPFMSSSVTFKGRFGISTDLDIFVLGIRPASFGAFAGSTLDAKVEGYAAYYPVAQKWAGWVCGSVGLKAGLQTYGDIRLKVRLSPSETEKAWWSFNQGFEYSMPPDDTYMGNYLNALFPNSDGGTCVTTDHIDFTHQELGPDADPAKARVQIDFAASFTDAALRKQADLWTLRLATGETIAIPAQSDGRAIVSLPRGATTNVRLDARSSKYGDVGLSANHNITITPGPTLAFSAVFSLEDCRQLIIDPNIYAPRGIKNVEWTIVGPNSSIIVRQSQAKFQIALPGCGIVSITGRVTDVGNYWAESIKSINTLIPPIVTQPGQDSILIKPDAIKIGELTTFTLTTNVIELPSSISMQLPDCSPNPMVQIPGGNSHKREFTCTPTGAAGTRTGLIKSSVGAEYGAEFTVVASLSSPQCNAPQILVNGICTTPVKWLYPLIKKKSSSKGDFYFAVPEGWVVSTATATGNATYDVAIGASGRVVVAHKDMDLRFPGIEQDLLIELSGIPCGRNHSQATDPQPGLANLRASSVKPFVDDTNLPQIGLMQGCMMTAKGSVRAKVQLKSTGELLFDEFIEVRPIHTKFSNTGSELPDGAVRGYGADEWGCTRINKNGLLVMLYDDVGENSVLPGRPGYPLGNQLNSIYTRYNNIDKANALNMCGRSNWRLPTNNEIWSVISVNIDPVVRVMSPAKFGSNNAAFWVFEVGVPGSPWYVADYGSSILGRFALQISNYPAGTGPVSDLNQVIYYSQPVSGP